MKKYLKPLGWMVLGGVITVATFAAVLGVWMYHDKNIRRVQNLEAALERANRELEGKEKAMAEEGSRHFENGYVIVIFDSEEKTSEKCLVVPDENHPDGGIVVACWPGEKP